MIMDSQNRIRSNSVVIEVFLTREFTPTSRLMPKSRLRQELIAKPIIHSCTLAPKYHLLFFGYCLS